MLPVGVQGHDHARAVGECALDPRAQRRTFAEVPRVHQHGGPLPPSPFPGFIPPSVLHHIDPRVGARPSGSPDDRGNRRGPLIGRGGGGDRAPPPPPPPPPHPPPALA